LQLNTSVLNSTYEIAFTGINIFAKSSSDTFEVSNSRLFKAVLSVFDFPNL